jgi:acyl carrier protein
MTRAEFTGEFAEMLNIDPTSLVPETELTSLPEWDSVAYLSTLVLIDDKLSFPIRPDAIAAARTFQDILEAVKAALHG